MNEGICNHWVSLLAHKFNNEAEFFFFDSRNADYLKWTEQEIVAGIRELAEKRIREGRPPYNGFKIMIHEQSIRDTQRVIEVLMNCLLGNTTLHKYNNDRRLEIMYNGIQAEVPGISPDFNAMKYDEIFSLKNKNLEQTLEALNNWIRCNHSLMKKFFICYHDKDDLDEEYNLKLKKFLDFFRNFYMFWIIGDKKELKKSIKVGYLLAPIKISPLFSYSNL